MKYIKIILGTLLMCSLVFSCTKSGDEQGHGEHEEHEEHEEHGEENVVTLSKLQMEAINLSFVQIEQRNMALGIQVTGELELLPQDKADISPILGGIVKSVKVIEGDKVKKGQVLAVLEHPDFIQYQLEYVNNLSELDYLEKEYARQKKLYDEKVGSGRDFQKVSKDYLISKSTVASLKAKLRMLGLNTNSIEHGRIYSSVNLISPMNGAVSMVKTNVGSYIEPMSKVFEVVNDRSLHADFRIYEKDVDKISVGQQLFFTTTGVSDKEFEGEIHAISPVFEENPKAVHVHADIINKSGSLIPGMYVQGRIIVKEVMTNVLPEHAIIDLDGKTYVFVKTVEKGGEETEITTFIMLEVVIGVSNENYVEVKLLDNFPKDAKIAGEGAYFILSELKKSEAGHHH